VQVGHLFGFTCDTYGNQANFVYDVAGYKFLTTVLGIPSDATNAAGNAMTVTFFKDGATQFGQAITISLDHPQSVHLNLEGASQLEMACNATDVTSHQPYTWMPRWETRRSVPAKAPRLTRSNGTPSGLRATREQP
jgi:hypothetical protein